MTHRGGNRSSLPPCARAMQSPSDPRLSPLFPSLDVPVSFSLLPFARLFAMCCLSTTRKCGCGYEIASCICSCIWHRTMRGQSPPWNLIVADYPRPIDLIKRGYFPTLLQYHHLPADRARPVISILYFMRYDSTTPIDICTRTARVHLRITLDKGTPHILVYFFGEKKCTWCRQKRINVTALVNIFRSRSISPLGLIVFSRNIPKPPTFNYSV